MISDKKRLESRLVMSRRSGICCVNYRNRIRGWILVRRRSARARGREEKEREVGGKVCLTKTKREKI